MKKLLVIIFLFILVNELCYGNKNDCEMEGLKAKVKEKVRLIYNTVTDFNSKSIYIHRYNEGGDLIEYIVYGKFIHRKYENEYDYNGNRTKQIQYTQLTSGEFVLLNKSIYKYNNNGNIVNKLEYDSTYKKKIDFTKESIYKYDDKGNLIEKAEYRSDKSLYSKQIYKYDNKQNKIEYIYHDYTDYSYTDKDTITKFKYEYDNKQNIIEEMQYNDDGNSINKIRYKYDKQGNMIEEAIYSFKKNKLVPEYYLQKWHYKYYE